MLAVVNVKLVSNFSVVGFGSNIVGSIECKLLFLQISVLTEKNCPSVGFEPREEIAYKSFLMGHSRPLFIYLRIFHI